MHSYETLPVLNPFNALLFELCKAAKQGQFVFSEPKFLGQGVQIELAIAVLHLYLPEIASYVSYPLLLPVGKDQHCTEEASFLHRQQFLLAKSDNMGLSPVVFVPLDVRSEHREGELAEAFPLSAFYFLSKAVKSVPELLLQLLGLFLHPESC